MPWLMCPYDMRRVPDLLLPVTLLSLSPCVVCGLWFGNRQVGYDNTVRDGEGCVHQFLYGEDGIDTVQTK